MQYASAPYVITEEEDSKDKKVGKAKNLSRYLTEKCKIWGIGRCFTPSPKGEKCLSSDINLSQTWRIFDKFEG